MIHPTKPAAFALMAMLAACTPGAVTTHNFAETVSGQVIDFYGEEGEILVYFGSERFLPDQSVVWVTASGICQEGEWFTSGDQICFNYGADDICWDLERANLVPGALFGFSGENTRAQAFPGSVTDVPQSCNG